MNSYLFEHELVVVIKHRTVQNIVLLKYYTVKSAVPLYEKFNSIHTLL